MISSDVSDLASEQLARRLQEEEDQLAAYQLQHRFNHSPARLNRASTHALNIQPGPSAGPARFYVTSDEEGDEEDVRELSFVQLSDDDISDRAVPMSPETNQLVTDALNTAFTGSAGSSTGSTNQTDDEIVILDDSAVEDNRPSRQNPRTSSEDSSDNIVWSVGRSTRSQTNGSNVSSSIVITNNSQAPSANTRSRTRNNQNRGRNSNSRSPNTRTSNSTTSRDSNSQAVHVIDRRHSPNARGRPTSRQQSNNNRGNNSNSDQQPTTSSGRRGHQSRNLFSNIQRGRSNVSSRVILNGIPVMDYQNGMPVFSNGLPVPPDLLQSRTRGPHWWAHQGLRGPGRSGVHMIFGQGSDNMTYEQMIALDDDISLEPGQGLSQHDISQFTLTQSYKKADNPGDKDDKSSCNICLSEFDEGEKIRTLPCFHSFHCKCIDNWLNRKAECPVCRSSVKPQSMSP